MSRVLMVCAILVTVLMVLDDDNGPRTAFAAVELRLDSLIDQARRTGGFTVDPRNGTNPDSGYAVATGRATARVEPAAEFFGGAGRELLERYLRDKAAALLADPALLVGGWYDQPGHRVVLSLVRLVTDRTTAIELGASYHQVTIYDLASGCAVPTSYTGHP